jgi:hypothetical protein
MKYRSWLFAATVACAGHLPVASANLIPPAPVRAPMILALKYVAYRDAQDRPLVEEREARELLAAVNRIYSTCSIQFQLEEFQAARPEEHRLSFQPSRMRELDPIRSSFEDPSRLVVIATGPWNRSGGLGSDGANAWTMMPGDRPSGTVVESTFARNVNLLAHELGHYLNLEHRTVRENLMNPVIYRDSVQLDPAQCDDIRSAATTWRSAALREIPPQPQIPTGTSGHVRAGKAGPTLRPNR